MLLSHLYIYICNPNCRVFQKATKEVREVLKVLEETIGDKKYFGGEEIGLLDINLGWIALSFGVIEDIVGD